MIEGFFFLSLFIRTSKVGRECTVHVGQQQEQQCQCRNHDDYDVDVDSIITFAMKDLMIAAAATN